MARRVAPVIDIAGASVDDVLAAGRADIDALLPEYLQSQRWFAAKGSPIESARIGDVVPIPSPNEPGRSVGNLAMIDVAYADGRAPERYATTLKAFREGAPRDAVDGAEVLANVRAADGNFVLADAITDRELVEGLVHAMRGGVDVAGEGAKLSGQGAAVLDDAVAGLGSIRVSPLSLKTSNTSVTVAGRDGRHYALKLVRRHDGELDGSTPTRALDVWKGAYLTNDAGYRNTPTVFGSMEHVGREGLPRTLTVLTEFTPNDGDGWADALIQARRTMDLVADGADPAAIRRSVDEYAAAARNHGRRLGEAHVALSSGPEGSGFTGTLQASDTVLKRTNALREQGDQVAKVLEAKGRGDAAEALRAGLPHRIDDVLAATDELVPIEEIQRHGDFHLGQLLKTGDDVQLIDWEGAPALTIAERWLPGSALDDVARQRSSYRYAANQALRDLAEQRPDLAPQLEEIGKRWHTASRDSFLTGWLDATADRRFRHARSEFVPELREAEIKNALDEIQYELGSRPDWVDIPLGHLRELL